MTNHRYTIRPESGGNATIHDRAGDTVGVVEDWTLFVGGVRIAEVDNYRDAVQRTERHITGEPRT